MGKCEKNQERILTMLRQYGRLSVGDVVSALKTSEATVRRYFTEMENRGVLMRIFGGVCLPVQARGEYHFGQQAAVRISEKQYIGREAANLLVSGDRIFFDSGTTVRECGNFLAELLVQDRLHDIHIVTNSLVYNEALPQYCCINLLGGTIRQPRMDLCGMTTLHNISRYNFTKVFLGADGVAADGTLSTTDEDTSLLAEAALEHCDEAFILADSSKLGFSSFAPYGKLRGGKYTLITDLQANLELLEIFRERGVRVIQAAPPVKRNIRNSK